MAPQTAQPEDLVTQQHTADAKVNQVFFIFAFGIGGLVVLSATAYACYYVVGRLRKSRVSAPATIEDATQVEVFRSAPRALKLPGMVQEGAKAPKRLILSPNYPLPVYTNFEWVEDLQEPRRKSWFKAGRRGRGLSLQGPVHVATRSMHQVQFPSAGVPKNVAIREVDEESYHRVSVEKHLSDFTIDEASILAEAATSHGPSSTSTATDPSRSLSTVMATSTPKVFPHMAPSPSIFIDEFNLPPPYECSTGADHSFLDFDEEKMPSQYLEVPTLACEAPEEARAGEVLTPAKVVKKKRSLSKLVSALGDLSNIGRRRSKSEISLKAHKFRKLDETYLKKERLVACSTPRAKENLCRAP